MSSCGAVQVPGCLGVGYPSVWISECRLSVYPAMGYKHIGISGCLSLAMGCPVLGVSVCLGVYVSRKGVCICWMGSVLVTVLSCGLELCQLNL